VPVQNILGHRRAVRPQPRQRQAKIRTRVVWAVTGGMSTWSYS
jgi:hypothetical protein